MQQWDRDTSGRLQRISAPIEQGSEISVPSDQMEHLGEEQYSEYLVERNPRAYMSMREYRDQWMGTPSYSVTLTYAPPPHPQYASWSHPQPPQPISPIEQAILDLTKLVGDAVVEQKEFNAQLSEKNPY